MKAYVLLAGDPDFLLFKERRGVSEGVSVWRRRFQSLRGQLEQEQASIPSLLHVMVQWPNPDESSRLWVGEYPAEYPLDKWAAGFDRSLSYTVSPHLFPGWMTSTCLAADRPIRDRATFFAGADRFLRIAVAAGKELAGHAIDGLTTESREDALSVWLGSLHVLYAPDRLFTWSDGVGESLPKPRQSHVHQCSVVTDVVMTSIMVMAALEAPDAPVQPTPWTLDCEESASARLKGLDGSDRPTSPEEVAELPEAPRLAWLEYEAVTSQHPELRTDAAVYGHLSMHGSPEDRELPMEEAWKRALGRARQQLGQQKNRPRQGRTGGSVIRGEDI